MNRPNQSTQKGMTESGGCFHEPKCTDFTSHMDKMALENKCNQEREEQIINNGQEYRGHGIPEWQAVYNHPSNHLEEESFEERVKRAKPGSIVEGSEEEVKNYRPKAPQEPKGWEEEFDKQFKITELYMPHVPVYWVKDFIRTQRAIWEKEAQQQGYNKGRRRCLEHHREDEMIAYQKELRADYDKDIAKARAEEREKTIKEFYNHPTT